jgi:hypothetical protein
MTRDDQPEPPPATDKDAPVEVDMTDLRARRGRGRTPAQRRMVRENEDVHAAGTPGGGLAAGGLAGTNIGDGDPDNADLEDAMRSGIDDTDGDDGDAIDQSL